MTGQPVLETNFETNKVQGVIVETQGNGEET
jgi:hypothetical protein